MLIALWKLNPANNEPIVPLDDFPRNLYSSYKSGHHQNDVFISADFSLKENLAQSIAKELKCDTEQVIKVLVQRMYNGHYHISFPYSTIQEFPSERIKNLIKEFKINLEKSDLFIKEDQDLKIVISDTIDQVSNFLTNEFVSKTNIEEIIKIFDTLISEKFGKKVKLPDYFNENLINKLNFFLDAFNGKPIDITEKVKKQILDDIPKFVYYSDYGNLNSEIFLPRVIEDFKRDDLTETSRAKVRTLKVLFKFVNLSPEEIYELGDDRRTFIKKVNHYDSVVSTEEQKPTEEEIKEWADKKRERGILLRSAASQMTINFEKWWLQGNYIFEFETDGNHFRINVSDKIRPEAIELEGRSRGLQWFFSFF